MRLPRHRLLLLCAILLLTSALAGCTAVYSQCESDDDCEYPQICLDPGGECGLPPEYECDNLTTRPCGTSERLRVGGGSSAAAPWQNTGACAEEGRVEFCVDGRYTFSTLEADARIRFMISEAQNPSNGLPDEDRARLQLLAGEASALLGGLTLCADSALLSDADFNIVLAERLETVCEGYPQVADYAGPDDLAYVEAVRDYWDDLDNRDQSRACLALAVEVCNGVDDNCNSIPDIGGDGQPTDTVLATNEACLRSFGACMRANVFQCLNPDDPDVACPFPSPDPVAAAEDPTTCVGDAPTSGCDTALCDGQDDNCDQIPDNIDLAVPSLNLLDNTTVSISPTQDWDAERLGPTDVTFGDENLADTVIIAAELDGAQTALPEVRVQVFDNTGAQQLGSNGVVVIGRDPVLARHALAVGGENDSAPLVLFTVSPVEAQCDNFLDDDDDGVIDCADPDCLINNSIRACGETSCGDGIDNDGDGRFDCSDAECWSDASCDFQPAGACTTGISRPDGSTFAVAVNEVEGIVLDSGASLSNIEVDALRAACSDPTCCNDSVCQVLTRNRPQCTREDCSNGVDDNGDTFIDAEDPQCCAPGDLGVIPACTPELCGNGLDDDGDGLFDCADSECCGVEYCANSQTCQGEVSCENGRDDDLNGLVDCMDPACASRTCCSARSILSEALPLSCTPFACASASALSDSLACQLSLSCVRTVETDPNRVLSNGDPCSTLSELDYPTYRDDPSLRQDFVTCFPCAVKEVCDNGIDDDGDNRIDCADTINCENFSGCKEFECSDGADDDGDGLTDCSDDDCRYAGACPEDPFCVNNCNDLLCHNSEACRELCSNGVPDDPTDDPTGTLRDCDNQRACGGTIFCQQEVVMRPLLVSNGSFSLGEPTCVSCDDRTEIAVTTDPDLLYKTDVRQLSVTSLNDIDSIQARSPLLVSYIRSRSPRTATSNSSVILTSFINADLGYVLDSNGSISYSGGAQNELRGVGRKILSAGASGEQQIKGLALTLNDDGREELALRREFCADTDNDTYAELLQAEPYDEEARQFEPSNRFWLLDARISRNLISEIPQEILLFDTRLPCIRPLRYGLLPEPERFEDVPYPTAIVQVSAAPRRDFDDLDALSDSLTVVAFWAAVDTLGQAPTGEPAFIEAGVGAGLHLHVYTEPDSSQSGLRFNPLHQLRLSKNADGGWSFIDPVVPPPPAAAPFQPDRILNPQLFHLRRDPALIDPDSNYSSNLAALIEGAGARASYCELEVERVLGSTNTPEELEARLALQAQECTEPVLLLFETDTEGDIEVHALIIDPLRGTILQQSGGPDLESLATSLDLSRLDVSVTPAGLSDRLITMDRYYLSGIKSGELVVQQLQCQ